MDFIIRRAQPQDAPDLERLLQQILNLHQAARPEVFKPGAQKYSLEQILELIENEQNPVFVALVSGQVAAYAICKHISYENHAVFKPHKKLYLDDFCVDETRRGLGIGTKLFDFLKGYTKEQGYAYLELNVWEFNQNAVDFYTKARLRTGKRLMEFWPE